MSEVDGKIESLTRDLPDPEGAKRFFFELQAKRATEAARLLREQNKGLLSDTLALAAWSQFLATSLLHHPEYIQWLGRKRRERQTRTTEDLLESLARFSLTNSTLDAHVLLARFRRRELLRIYLDDIRGLATVAETTEDLSNLADACLEHALRLARQELDNRFGVPLEIDEKGKAKPAQFCVVALGKLGSRELNYASDIDLLFLYSNDGTTSGTGTRESVTNREYFVKLAEKLSGIIGAQSNEGAAYRVDLRLRPHGRVGALAIPLKEAISYYKTAARDWERQVLLRSRASAGGSSVYRDFWVEIESFVYRREETLENALANVRLSKQKINQEHQSESGYNVKLGQGGIREIEFIAQALQLAEGGRDAWLRAPHTLIALRRLADRNLIREHELAALSDAYAFLRRLEHRLQMEHGLQTHSVPEDNEKRLLIARRMNFTDLRFFDESLRFHTGKVTEVYERIFSLVAENAEPERIISQVSQSISAPATKQPKPVAVKAEAAEFESKKYGEILPQAVSEAENLHDELAVLRLEWRRFYDEIRRFDEAGKLPLSDSKRLQTALAEAALDAAHVIAAKEISRRYEELRDSGHKLRMGVLGLGKLGSRGMDFGSDLDLIVIYDDKDDFSFAGLTAAQVYAQATETIVNALSSLTRDGFLYRVDLRLRPDGKNGAICSGAAAFLCYLETRADVWEWLAYVKLRAAAGDLEFAGKVEREARKIIHERAKLAGQFVLKAETKKMRERLESEKQKRIRRGERDIKHGTGGLLDIYFAVRYLQLRDSIPDEDDNRATSFSLEKLHSAAALDDESFAVFAQGYDFLRRLDHALRLTAGRSALLPAAGHPLLEQIAEKLNLASSTEMLEQFDLHSAAIRRIFNKILS